MPPLDVDQSTEDYLTFPRSSFDGWKHPAPHKKESYVIDQILQTYHHTRPDDCMIDLTGFAVYRSRQAAKRPGELVSLSSLKTEPGCDDLCFDGCVKVEDKLLYLENVKFGTVVIDGYGDSSSASVDHGISIQTDTSAKHNIWYSLSHPAAEYRRYHDVFLWVAHLAKYTVEFMAESTGNVSLHDFRREFVSWANRSYGGEPKFRQWLTLIHGTDFRSAISAHNQFLWKEAYSIDPDLACHSLWTEIGAQGLEAIQAYGSSDATTTVTPFVYQVFRNMYFGSMLKMQERSPATERLAEQRRRLLALTPLTSLFSDRPSTAPSQTCHVAVGDVISLEPDENSVWKTVHWYAYVQAIQESKPGQTKLHLLWVYAPSDTPIGQSAYPFQNELFLSSHCTCEGAPYDLSKVTGKLDVSWGQIDPVEAQLSNNFVVRQTYKTETHEFVSVHQSHLVCRHRRKTPKPTGYDAACADYSKGDFVLYRSADWDEDPMLRPAQILDFLPRQRRVLLRQLPPVAGRQQNRVNFSTNTFSLSPGLLKRHCQIMGFPDVAAVPELYLRGGAGDLFFYIFEDVDPNAYAAIKPQTDHVTTRLEGMGICCGGGSLDRGLEDGGATKFKHAIDYDANAIHTYRANTINPESVNFFLGPMEQYLRDAIAGNPTDYTKALVGEVELIAAGSPCPGFSKLQLNRFSDDSKKRASLVACVMAYIDHYMPYYFVLENVLGMSTIPKGASQDQNVLSQIVGCLVALGYQTQQIIMDVPAFNGFQNRHRVFVLASAPGLKPIPHPVQTSHRPKDSKGRKPSLGRLSSGQRYGSAEDEMAPFRMTTFEAGTSDLPDIGDGHVYACIAYPDHVVGRRQGVMERDLIARIPKKPWGMGIAKAHAMGKITKAQEARCLHPEQDRLLTVMEARRAQGFPDDEVILGDPRMQWKIIGNSVHRNVAFALGLSLKDAFLKSEKMIESLDSGVPATSEKTVKSEPLRSKVNPYTTSLALPASSKGLAYSRQPAKNDGAKLKAKDGDIDMVITETTTITTTTTVTTSMKRELNPSQEGLAISKRSKVIEENIKNYEDI
ncbi:S-adenosyl-L-methionine-dependent methyltransferase [Myriangium duriaei CBS 260.36]|uniref:DNA (cytosine-5-)-methyltransferase n=1 Tax=Myriangium duriaei CBS 260.36 TaxID=1168546 RepID=A0A9P4J1B9_9PEZI|nr:S-adenosyl-L-methionine-dependent methyltransferase [Myriangium duriaei CBS 260.36]